MQPWDIASIVVDFITGDNDSIPRRIIIIPTLQGSHSALCIWRVPGVVIDLVITESDIIRLDCADAAAAAVMNPILENSNVMRVSATSTIYCNSSASGKRV